ncbi:MAG: hypothetical protein IJA67_06195 [Oscillospiraceae bacterium]|nr:hypothetical protein [Oscillospiraceae bacterium]
MKNLKKAIALLLAAVLLVAASVVGTIAYLTDSDADVNVMSAGNVYIVQNETDRDGNAFVNGQKLLPATKGDGYLSKDGTMTDTDDKTSLNIWDKSINNEIDKFVSVTNVGTEAAYVRTILLFETVKSYKEGSSTEYTDLHDHFLLMNGDYTYLKDDAGKFVYVTIDGTEYVIAVKTYADPLEAGATTTASLRQFALTWEAGNEFYDFFGPEYDIVVFSQAVQKQGFETVGAEAALNEAFGEVTSANVADWVATTAIKTAGPNNVINP